MRRRDVLSGLFAATIANKASAVPIAWLPQDRIMPPPSFRYRPSAYALFRQPNGQIRHTFSPKQLNPAIDVQYFMDPVNGNDANNGLTSGAPKQKLATCLALAPAGNTIGIQIILSADFVARTTFGWNNVQPTKNVIITVPSGFRFQSCKTASSLAPTWTVNIPNANVYQATIATVKNVIDLKGKVQPAVTIPAGKFVTVDGTYVLGDGSTPTSINTASPIYPVLTNVASIAAVSALAGSWFYDGTIVYVRASDDRVLIGDNQMIVTTSGNNGRFPTAINNQFIYAENIDFVGGSTPFLASFASSVTGCLFVHNNCSFQGSDSTSNGLSVAAFMRVYGYRSGAYNNFADGFNYHSNEQNGTTPGTSPNWQEFECVALGNGTTGSSGASDNGSTCHDFCNGIRVNCIYPNSDDHVIAETNSAMSWNLGCYVGQPIKTGVGEEATAALLLAQQWWDNCVIATGTNNQAVVEAGAAYRFHNMPPPSNTGPTVLAQY